MANRVSLTFEYMYRYSEITLRWYGTTGTSTKYVLYTGVQVHPDRSGNSPILALALKEALGA